MQIMTITAWATAKKYLPHTARQYAKKHSIGKKLGPYRVIEIGSDEEAEFIKIMDRAEVRAGRGKYYHVSQWAILHGYQTATALKIARQIGVGEADGKYLYIYPGTEDEKKLLAEMEKRSKKTKIIVDSSSLM